MKERLLASALVLTAAVSMGATSCATPILPTSTPLDSNRYEAPFKFQCGGKEVFAIGSATCQYKEGDKITIKIKAPKSRGEIQVRSCRHGRALDIDESKSWQEVEWVQYTREDSCPIVFTVATREGGVQMGKIFPYVESQAYPALNGAGSLYCWESEQVEEFRGQLSCQVPTGIKTNGFVTLNPAKAGQYLIVSPCLPAKVTGSFVKGAAPIKWSVQVATAQFCPVSAAVKYEDGSFEEQEVYLDFFDNTYRTLPPPITGEKDGDSYACAPQDFKFFDLNDRTKKAGLLAGRCIKDGWLHDNLAVAIAWDAAGRSSYSVYTKKGTVWNSETELSQILYRLKSPQSRTLSQ